MLRLTPRRRAVLAEKLPDVANLITAAIVIGFAIGQPTVSWSVLITTLALWIAALLFAVGIAEGGS